MNALAGRFRNASSRIPVWLWYVAPILLIAHAIGFWGRGILDEEAMFYIQKYLADRSLLATVFNPNDATLYQARELSYLVDIVDARVLAWLLDRGLVLFIPMSGALGLMGLAWLYLRGARRVLRLDEATSALVLSLFLSCIVIQASTPIFYRSAKILLALVLFVFLFKVVSLLWRRNDARPMGAWGLAAVSLSGFAMSLCDRQGFFFLLTTALTLTVMWLAAVARRSPHAADRLRLAGACAVAALAAMVYGYSVAPWAIAAINGVQVTFNYQQQSFTDFNWTVLSGGAAMFFAQVSYLFGNVPFVIVAAIASVAGALALRRHRSTIGPRMLISDAFVVGGVLLSAPIMLLAVMVMYHRPVYEMPDHALWYYTIPILAVLTFGVSLLTARLELGHRPGIRRLIHVALVAMIASNILHYAGQRHRMIDSPYFAEQYARSRQIIESADDARAERHAVGERPWLRVEPAGAVVSLPIEDEAFVEEVRAAYATFRHRDPLQSAPGPFWARLYEFLSSSPALFEDAEELRSLVDGLRSVGVHRLELRLQPNDAHAREMADALRAADFTAPERAPNDMLAFGLIRDAGPPAPSTLRQVPVETIVAVASQQQGDIAKAFDRDDGSYWSSGVPQVGDEWLRLEFPQPIDVGCVRLLFNAGNPGRNPPAPRPGRSPGSLDPGAKVFPGAFRPRGLVIESQGDGVAVSETFNPLASLIRALLREPERPVMTFCLQPNRSRTLVLRQTGRSATDPWNVSELTVWERR